MPRAPSGTTSLRHFVLKPKLLWNRLHWNSYMGPCLTPINFGVLSSLSSLQVSHPSCPSVLRFTLSPSDPPGVPPGSLVPSRHPGYVCRRFTVPHTCPVPTSVVSQVWPRPPWEAPSRVRYPLLYLRAGPQTRPSTGAGGRATFLVQGPVVSRPWTPFAIPVVLLTGGCGTGRSTKTLGPKTD